MCPRSFYEVAVCPCLLSLLMESEMEMCSKQSLDLFSSQKIPDVYREHSKLSGCKRLSKGQVHCFCPWKVLRATAHFSRRAGGGFPLPSIFRTCWTLWILRWSVKSWVRSSQFSTLDQNFGPPRITFCAPSLWCSSFFLGVEEEEDSGTIKITTSHLPSLFS